MTIGIFANLRRKKGRSFLTILGIVIAISSVIIIGTVGSIGTDAIRSELNSLGMNGITVSASTPSTVQLNKKDLEMIKSLKYVRNATPLIINYTQAISGRCATDAVIWGIDSGSNQIIKLTSTNGRLFNSSDINASGKVCLVDESFAHAAYGRTNIVGKRVKLLIGGKYESFIVIGTVASGGNILQGLLNGYIPSFLYIPYTTMQEITGQEGYEQIAVSISSNSSADYISKKIIASLEQLNSNKGGYKSDNLSKQKEQLNNILSIISTSLSMIAAISLVVAGLSIMTVMTVSVTERTREIGIKKAIGASQLKIMCEFLIESATITLIGGLIGCAVGISISLIGCLIIGISPSLNINLTVLCVVFSAIIGIIFGVWPAFKASKLKPVEALRHN